MRTPKEIFDHHLAAFVQRDLEAVVADYSEDAVYISSAGVVERGKAGIRKVYQDYFSSTPPDPQASLTKLVIEGDIVYLEWATANPDAVLKKGTDTFVIRENEIYAQTANF